MSDSHSNPWRRKSRHVAYSNPWIEVLHDEVTQPDGEPGIYGVVHFRNRAIGVVPLDEVADRVLLVGQYRYALDRYSWEIPEGGGRFDEEPEESARRELAEETDEVAVLFAAAGLEAGAADPEGTEQIETRWVAFADAMAMIGRGEITDALTIVALQAVALERGRKS